MGSTESERSIREPWKAFQVRDRSSMEIKRDAVLLTAAHLFLEHGYQKTTMHLIAARLKITKPALYYYFKNKDDILVGCYREGIARIEAQLPKLNEDVGTGLARLRLYVHAYAMAVLTYEFGRCVAIIDDSELSLDAQIEVRKVKRRIDMAVRGLVEVGMNDGSIAPCNPKLVSFAVAGAINWAGTWFRPEGETQPEEIACEFTHLLTGGLGLQSNRMGGG